MTTGLHIKHNFVSAKADGTDNTLVKPSNWNEDHVINMDSGFVLGNQSGVNGPVQQLACSAAAASMLSQASTAAILSFLGVSPPTTGDAKLTLKSTADTTWVMLDDGTIGNATSGASTRANADTQNLFLLLYAAPFTDASVPILTSTGVATTRAAQGAAATAYANSCRLTLPMALGRAFIVAGAAGSGLTARVLGTSGGEENHLLSTTEIPSHYHAAAMYDPGHSHGFSQAYWNGGSAGGGGLSPFTAYRTYNTAAATTGVRVYSANGNDTTGSTGGSGSHNNMQPWAAWNVMVKL